MYRISHFRLHNTCQHADFASDLYEGLTSVTGPNFSGKTNVLRGIAYALTGLVDGLWGSQQQLQKDGTADPGYAEVTMADGGASFTVRRFYTQNVKFPDVLLRHGLPDVTGRRPVNALVSQLLGVPVPLLFQVFWGRQGMLAQLIVSPASEVNDFLAQLFDTKRLDKARAALLAQQQAIVRPSSDCVTQLQAVEDALRALPSAEELEARRDRAVSGVDAAMPRYTELSGKLSRENAVRQDVHDGLVASLREERDALRAELAGMPDESEEIPPEDQGRLMDKAGRAGREGARLLAEAEKARAEAAAAEESAGRLDSEIAGLDAGIDRLRGQLGSDGRCPVCGGPVDGSCRDRVAEFLSGGRFSSADEYERSLAGDRAAMSGRRTGLLEEAARLRAREKTLRDDAVKAEAEADSFRVRYQIAYDTAVRAGRRDAIARRLAEIDGQLDGTASGLTIYTAGEQAELQALSARLSSLQAELQHVAEESAGVEARRTALEAERESLTGMVRRRETAMAAYECLGELRAKMAPSVVLTRYLRRRIQALNALIARNLKMTGMPFTMYLNEDTHVFEFMNQDGSVHQTTQLSGAQQSMAAIAFRMALSSLLGTQVNLFMVDEPAEALDADNKRILADMFQAMNGRLRGTAGQMLIVTRDQDIIDACPHNVSTDQ